MPAGTTSIAARIAESAALQPDAPALSSFGRGWSYAQLAERTGRITGALARLGVGPDKRLGLLLPPVPTAAMAAVAGLRLGAEVVPCDPLQRDAALSARLHDIAGGVLVSLDLTRLQERWLTVLQDGGPDAVLVDKMAELLPFPRNLMAPLMRGGELAPIPRRPDTSALPRLLAAESARPGTLDSGADAVVVGADGRAHDDGDLVDAADALLETAGGAGRWLLAHHIDDAWALTALLAPLGAGREVVLLPRLDPRTVAAAAAHERPRVAVVSQAVAEALVQTPPESGSLSLLVVPPQLSADTAAALEQATGARVAAWPGP